MSQPGEQERAEKLSDAIAASKRAEREEYEADLERLRAADERVVEALADRPPKPGDVEDDATG